MQNPVSKDNGRPRILVLSDSYKFIRTVTLILGDYASVDGYLFGNCEKKEYLQKTIDSDLVILGILTGSIYKPWQPIFEKIDEQQPGTHTPVMVVSTQEAGCLPERVVSLDFPFTIQDLRQTAERLINHEVVTSL